MKVLLRGGKGGGGRRLERGRKTFEEFMEGSLRGRYAGKKKTRSARTNSEDTQEMSLPRRKLKKKAKVASKEKEKS